MIAVTGCSGKGIQRPRLLSYLTVEAGNWFIIACSGTDRYLNFGLALSRLRVLFLAISGVRRVGRHRCLLALKKDS